MTKGQVVKKTYQLWIYVLEIHILPLLTDLKTKININSIIVGNFNIWLTIMDKSWDKN